MVTASSQKDDQLNDFIGEDGHAVYASHPEESKGRIHPEDKSKTRGDFERDRDRIIYSAAFRGLKFKTQVFAFHEGDNYRTRLSHSMEVAQVARYLSRMLHVDEDLAETCALAHDLGHAPFAHAGQEALQECMKPYGGFDHNDQTLRMVTMLEKKYPHFDGLNLCWESLEGLVKHSGPVASEKVGITLSDLMKEKDFMLDTYASVEAQIAGISDDIAYNSHDLEDALTAGIFSLDDLEKVDWVGDIVKEKRKLYPDVTKEIIEQEVTRDVMGVYASDVLAETRKRIITLSPKSVDDVRNAKKAVVAMSDEMQEKDKVLREFLMDNFYRHTSVNRMAYRAFTTVQDLFEVFMKHRRCMPAELLERSNDVPEGWEEEKWRARNIADYIATMTDRKAIAEHKEIFYKYQVIK